MQGKRYTLSVRLHWDGGRVRFHVGCGYTMAELVEEDSPL